MIRPADEAIVVGAIAIGMCPPGRRTYLVRFETPTAVETTLAVEVIPAVVKLEFAPPELALRQAQPGTTLQRSLTLNNAGNVNVSATITASEPWLSLLPERVDLAPGQSMRIKVSARTRKTDFGLRTAEVRATPREGDGCAAQVRIELPQPKVAAEPVDFGDILPDRTVQQTVVLRNVGKVRVACSLETDQPWLTVAPGLVNLPAGREKTLILRALVPSDDAGSKNAVLRINFAGGELLRVPVSLFCRIPRPLLGSIRKQTLGAIATDASVVRRFRIANVGDGRLRCTVAADQPWIEVLTPELTVAAGKKRRIEYVVHAPTLEPGLHQATIHIRGNGGDADIPVTARVVKPSPELELLGDLDLGTVWSGNATGHLSIRNCGVGLLHVRTLADDSRVTVSPAELEVLPGPPAKLAVAVATEESPGGAHECPIQLTSNGGSAAAVVRFRVPVEALDAPVLLDLGNRRTGRPTDDVVLLTNTGPDRITLSVETEVPWIQPAQSSIALEPGEARELPFRTVLQRGASGRITGAIRLVGRKSHHNIVVRAQARTVELKVMPHTLELGAMRPGEVRTIVFQLENWGDMATEIGDLHVTGPLEVQIGRHTIAPLDTVDIRASVRMHAVHPGAQVRTRLLLEEDAVIHFRAEVAKPGMRRFIAPIVAGVGLACGIAFWMNGLEVIGWSTGILLLLAAIRYYVTTSRL